MKKILIKYLTVILALVFVTQSCSEDFLVVENKNRLALSSFYKTPTDALYALNTLYNPLAFHGIFGLRQLLMFNSFDDRVIFETTGRDEFVFGSGDGDVSNNFRHLYVGLWRCSHYLKNIQSTDIPNFDPDVEANYIAQAKALRAMYYFYLVTIYDRPIFYDETTLPEDPLIAFSNGDQIQFWNKIVQDCQEAIPDLPDSYDADNLGRITKGAAKSLLGKAMLYKHYYYHMRFGTGGSAEDLQDLNLARTMLGEVINSNVYELIKPYGTERIDYINAFLCNFSFVDLPSSIEDKAYPSENNLESVWQVQYSDDRIAQGWLPGWQWSGALNFHYFSAHPSSFRNFEVHPDLWLQFETTGAPAGFDRDPRAYGTCWLDGEFLDFRPGSLYEKTKYTSGANNKKIADGRGLTFPGQPTVGFGPKKYSYPTYYEKDSPRNDPFNINVIRYADVLLMYAEVMEILGDDGSGIEALNKVRERAGMPEVAGLTKAVIMHERDVELATEGLRFFDLVRWSFDPAWNIDWFSIYSRQSGTPKNIFQVGKNEFLPIPISEINKNRGLLKQNPGW